MNNQLAKIVIGIASVALFAQGAFAGEKAAGRLESDFKMTRTLAVMQDALESSGRLSIGGVGLLRWETQKPTRSVLIINGKKAWIHYPEFNLVKDFDLGKDPVMKVLSSHLLALTSGDLTKIGELYFVKVMLDGKKELTPKDASVKKMFTKIRVALNENGAAEHVEMFSAGGDVTAITFENVRLDPDLSPSLFTKPKVRK